MPKRIFLILLILGSGFYLTRPEAGVVSKRIGHEVRDKHAQHIDMAELTDFPWDKLYLFGPYQAREAICSTLNISGAQCRQVSPEIIEEGDFLLVFRDRRNIVHVERHRRYLGDFSGTQKPQPILRADAQFIVKQRSIASDGNPWFVLELAGGLLPYQENECHRCAGRLK